MVFRKRQQLIICVLAGTMVGGFLLFRYLPLQRRMKAVRSQRDATEIAISQALTQKEQLPGLKEQLQRFEGVLGKYEMNVPTERDLGTFLQRIANLMNEQKLKDQLIRPGRETASEQLNCIPVSMRCRGGLEQIFEFYKSLQSLDRLVRIERVELLNDSNFNGEVSMQTKAVIYYRPQAGQG